METVARNLVFRGVTLVTLNYRLGALGFMSVNYGDRIEGNFGIYDIKLALEWLQRNAKVCQKEILCCIHFVSGVGVLQQFNGDPTRVTVMGESAGAAAASVLAASPLTQNLVHQLIALSGSATAGWAIHRHGQNA